MPLNTTLTFQARSYEIGPDGSIHHAVLLNWCQETAYAGSTAGGYPPEAYAAMGAFWVMHSMDVHFLAPIGFGDEVEVATWISDFQRVRSHREYRLTLVGSKRVVACGRAHWVFMDSEAGTPRRIPPELIASAEPNHEPALAPYPWPEAAPTPFLHYQGQRRVSYHELDELNHVNNAVYLSWIEQQIRDCWQATQGGRPLPAITRHFLEYRRSALPGDALTLSSQADPIDGGLVWHHQVRRGDELLVSARSLTAS